MANQSNALKGSNLKVSNGEFTKSRVSLVISSVIVDRERGASLVDNVFGDEMNVDFIVHKMRGDREMRQSISKLLISGVMGPIFQDVIGTDTFRAGGLRESKTGIYKAAEKYAEGSDQSMIITEMMMPSMIANNLVSTQTKFAVRRKLPYVEVTTSHISDDLLKQELSKSLNEAKRLVTIPSGIHSTAAVADMFAEAFRNVGISLMIMNDYEGVLHDIVLGVLANLDVAPLTTQKGSVSNYLRSHAVVQQLVSNLTFIRAALDMRSNISGLYGPSTGVRQQVSEFMFDKHAPVVLTMIRNSDRYEMVSKASYLSTVGVRKVLNLKGLPVSSVVYDNVGIEATAMAVVSIKDISFPDALNLQELPDRVSERMISTYGTLDKTLSLPFASAYLADIVELLVQDGVDVGRTYTCRMNESEKVFDKMTLALLAAKQVTAEFNELGRAGEPAYSFVFSGPSSYSALELKSGTIMAGLVTTTDPEELLLAIDAWDGSTTMNIPPQLIPKTSLRSKLIGFDKEDFITAEQRGGYAIDVMGVSIKGAIRLKELSTIRMGELATLVAPNHNAKLYDVVESIFKLMLELSGKAKTAAVKKRSERIIAQYALEIAQSLQSSFRAEIHDNIVEKAATTLSYEESIQMRANMRQHALAAYADIVAATVFLRLQGLARKTTLFDNLVDNDEIKAYWTETGSDR